jgi:hypothetical protein
MIYLNKFDYMITGKKPKKMSKHSATHLYDSYLSHHPKINPLLICTDFKDTKSYIQHELSEISRAFESMSALSEYKLSVRQIPRRCITCPSPPRATTICQYSWAHTHK